MSLFQCPHCHGTLENDGTIRGHVACPHCAGQFVVPIGPPFPTPSPAAPTFRVKYRRPWSALITGGIAAAIILGAAIYSFSGRGPSPGTAPIGDAAAKTKTGISGSGVAEPTSAEKQLVKGWWRENEPDPDSIEPIRWEAGTIERDPGWKGTRVIWVKYRHQHMFGGKNVTEAIFRISPQKGFNYCDTAEFRGWYWNWPAFVGP